MTHQPLSVLVVDDDASVAAALPVCAGRRGVSVRQAFTLAAVRSALAGEPFDVAIVPLDGGAESCLEVMRHIQAADGDTEFVVTVSNGSSGAVLGEDLPAVTFARKPIEPGELGATLRAAAERRRMQRQNRRLVWELRTINEIAEGIARSLKLDDILVGALQQAVNALSAVGGSIRLRDDTTGLYELAAVVGPPALLQMWERANLRPHRPSDRVIATGSSVMIEDLRALVPAEAADGLPAASGLSVPMLAGTELLGTLTLGADRPNAFALADQRLLAIVAGQIAVAIQNARLHESISRGKREWEQTFDAISEPVAVFDGRGDLLRGNQALARYLGRDVTDLKGQSCRTIGLCGPDAECAVARALAGATSRIEVATPDGRIFSVTAFPVASYGGAASVVLIAKDVTEEIASARRLQQMSGQLAEANARSLAALERLKSTQAQLLQAEKLSAIGQLVAGVAHELNNPLTSVIGYSQLLQEEIADSGELLPPQVSSDLRRIADEAERAARIVRNLLAFARRQAASREPQDVADLVSRVLALRTYELRINGIQLDTAFEAGLPAVVADGGQLQQALLNLVLNAEQAMRSRTVRRLTVGARVERASGAVVLTVADTGHGIDEANRSRIFDPFFTTRDVGEGTGLGLSICYGIVRDHGGEIHVESTPDVGTCFSIVLPASPGIAPAEAVLVAMADEGERGYLAAMLGGWGFKTVTAATSAEALARCGPDLHAALVDRALLAAGLDGWRAARANEPLPPLIFVSASAEDTDVDRFGREQAAAVLAPPFPLRAVHEAVAAVTRECV